ncbi:MAG: hypothetical protein M1826_001823 [Phylliscum demangeonii]|nr:MAG: hypothetical protein M1826_001823 [Phylliscum demangeonii]
MQAILLLWTGVAAAGVAFSAPLEERPAAAAEHAGESGVNPLGKRAMRDNRPDAIHDVARCVWDVYKVDDTMESCIRQYNAEKWHLSAKEVRRRYVEICMLQWGQVFRVDCEERAEKVFRYDDRAHPSAFRRIAKIMNHRIKTTGHALVRAAQRTGSRTWSWAKSIFNRPSAFQTSVRNKEGVAAMHPIRPILVPE